ncbi:hypothetical protein D3C72_1886350 [compost metagenome]
MQLIRQHRLARGGAQRFARIVADHACLRPFQAQLAFQQLPDEGQLAHGFGIGRGFGRTLDFGGVGFQFVQFVGSGLLEQAVHRIGGIAGPVAVKIRGHVVDRGADGQHVQVREEHAVGCAEVFVAHIAAADDGGLVVRREGLVVHAAVQAAEVRHVA